MCRIPCTAAHWMELWEKEQLGMKRSGARWGTVRLRGRKKDFHECRKVICRVRAMSYLTERKKKEGR